MTDKPAAEPFIPNAVEARAAALSKATDFFMRQSEVEWAMNGLADKDKGQFREVVKAALQAYAEAANQELRRLLGKILNNRFTITMDDGVRRLYIVPEDWAKAAALLGPQHGQ